MGSPDSDGPWETAAHSRHGSLSWRELAWASAASAVLLAPLLGGGLLAVVATALGSWAGGTWGGLLVIAGLGAGCGLMILGAMRERRAKDPGDGVPLEPAEAPGLFLMIRELGGRFGDVRVVPEMNASVGCRSRGPFPCRSVLVLRLGLSLMDVLSPEEFRAVLAHEVGHGAHGFGWKGRWLCWLRQRCSHKALAARHSGSGGMPGLGRFWIRCFEQQMEQARRLELEADRAVAGRGAARPLAVALCRLTIEATRAERFRQLYARAADAELPEDYHERLQARLAQPWTESRCRRTLAEALGGAGEAAKAHPRLAVRLAALGVEIDSGHPELPAAIGRSATEAYLDPDRVRRLRAEFSREWRRKQMESERNGPRSVAARWRRIAGLMRLEGLGRMQAEVVSLLESAPEHPGASYLRGSYLATSGDGEAIGYLERATDDPGTAPQAHAALVRFYEKRGDASAAEAIRQRSARFEQDLKRALQERGELRGADRFLSAELHPDDLSELVAGLNAEPAIRRAWVASKVVEHFAHWPHHVLLLEMEPNLPASAGGDARRDVVGRLQRLIDLPGYTHVALLHETDRRVSRALRKAAGAPVFRRVRPFLGD